MWGSERDEAPAGDPLAYHGRDMDRDRVIAELKDYFRARGDGLLAAYLFGSVARGEAGPASDVDLGILLVGGPPRSVAEYPIALVPEIERRLSMPVDLIVLNGAPPDFLHRVLRDGIVVHEGDHAARVAFEVKARNDFFDLQPILERHRRAVLGAA